LAMWYIVLLGTALVVCCCLQRLNQPAPRDNTAMLVGVASLMGMIAVTSSGMVHLSKC
jgi:hypothetical protein